VIDLLTWEEIRDWQLDGGFGWGSLLQLDRFADAIDEVDIRNLMGRVIGGEISIGDIRTSVRSVTRYDADFEDVLTRIVGGANSGELNQFYRLAQDLGVDAAELDGYMGDEMSLAELRQSSKLAERMGVELTDVISVGVAEFRSLQRETERTERETARDERTAERIAERLAEQFEGAVATDVMAYFEECDGKWGCVRKKMRDQEQTQTQDTTSQENSKASQIAAQFDVSKEEVLLTYAACHSDWGCVRAHFRSQNKTNQGKGKNK
jgi:NACalpha-BTF3-like transcription factor